MKDLEPQSWNLGERLLISSFYQSDRRTAGMLRFPPGRCRLDDV
jgi:hypothetical protein